MNTESNTELVANRYIGYIKELREFFRGAQLQFGAPENILALSARMNDESAFRDDLAAMARSFIFREGGAVPPTELLEIIAVAIGGAGIDDQAEKYHEQVRDLLVFLIKLARSPMNQPRNSGVSTSAAAVGGFHEAGADRSAAVLTEEEPMPQDPLYEPESPARIPDKLPRRPSALRRWWWIGALGAVILTMSALVLLPGTQSRSQSNRDSVSANMSLGLSGTRAAPKPSAAGEPVSQPARASGAPERTSSSTLGAHPSQPVDSAAPRAGASGQTAPFEMDVVHPPGDPAGTAATDHPAPPTRDQNNRLASELSTPPLSPGAGFDSDTSAGRHDSAAGGTRSSTVPGAYSGIYRQGKVHGLLDVSSGVMGSNLLYAPPPQYPKLASFVHVEGPVILQAVIARDGRVAATHVLRGHHLLRGAAVDAVRKWRYRPYTVGGRPVDVATVVTVNFRLPHH